jgi:energy-coupling factor transporter ATP-binding protein EcfA2
MPALLHTRSGQPEPILVLGSSGSGKTTFAAKVLPGLIASTTKNEQYFTVYLRAGLVTNGGKENSLADVVKRTKLEIGNIVPGIEHQQATPLDMCMIVVIDELGTKDHSGFSSNKEHLKQIVEGLNSIAKEVWLVLAGTGLDVITSDLNSRSDVTKIRMKPGGKEQILWLARDRRGEGFMEVVKKVERNPILTRLASNARAAEFLVRSVGELMSYCFESAGIVDTVVKKVAYDYILANGLNTCTAEQRRLVAHLVLKAVGSAKEGGVTQPTFDCGGDVKVERACRSLVDTHIEDGMLAHGQKFAVSMTPAITIVVAAPLTGNLSSLSSDWSGFECIVALCEGVLASLVCCRSTPGA